MDEMALRVEERPFLRPELIAPWWEIAVVLAIMLGPFAYSSARGAMRSDSTSVITLIVSNREFLRLAAMEGALLAGLFFFLHWRGWRRRDFNIRIDAKGTLAMPVIQIAAVTANIFTALGLMMLGLLVRPHPHGLMAAFVAQSPHLGHHSIEVAWICLIGGSILNAFYEELIFMGYAFNQFAARYGPVFAVLAMVLLRMLLHTYKGPAGMLGIGAFALIYGVAYFYLRRLWPLILGHALIDLLAFSLVKIVLGR